MKKSLVEFSVLCLALVMTNATAQAQPELWIVDDSSRLGTLNLQTGAVNVIGATNGTAPLTSANAMTDIAFAPDGKLYGISYTGFFEIDPTTASATYIGAHGIDQGNALLFAADGTLYSASGSSSNPTYGGLFEINVATGVGTQIGNTGFSSAGDLAFVGSNLYMSSGSAQLISVDLSSSGLGTAVGPFGYSFVWGLAADHNGTLYGSALNSVFTVNTSTGAGTLAHSTSGKGLGFTLGTTFRFVPEPSALTLSLLGCLLVPAMCYRQRNAD